MEREIKFRVWDKDRGWWHRTNERAFHLFGENVLLGYVTMRPDDSHVRLEELSDLIPMQFTGLKDKNGTEIYEGDVVRWSDNFEKRVFCYESPVVFMRGAWYLKTDAAMQHSGSDLLFEIIWDEQENVEVIGNIYENADLLMEQAA